VAPVLEVSGGGAFLIRSLNPDDLFTPSSSSVTPSRVQSAGRRRLPDRQRARRDCGGHRTRVHERCVGPRGPRRQAGRECTGGIQHAHGATHRGRRPSARTSWRRHGRRPAQDRRRGDDTNTVSLLGDESLLATRRAWTQIPSTPRQYRGSGIPCSLRVAGGPLRLAGPVDAYAILLRCSSFSR
jgi:hypothetical protein